MDLNGSNVSCTGSGSLSAAQVYAHVLHMCNISDEWPLSTLRPRLLVHMCIDLHEFGALIIKNRAFYMLFELGCLRNRECTLMDYTL